MKSIFTTRHHKIRYILLIPILVALFSLAYIDYLYFNKIKISNNLSEKIERQIAIKNIIKTLLVEGTIVKKVKNFASTGEYDTAKKSTDNSIEKFSQLDESTGNSLSAQLKTVREGLLRGEEWLSDTFFNFYDHIADLLTLNYAGFQYHKDLNLNINLHLVSLKSLYDSMDSIIINRRDIHNARQNLKHVTKQKMNNWLNLSNIVEQAGLNFMPNSNTKIEILTFLTSDEIKRIANNYIEFRKSILLDTKDSYQISEKDLELTDILVLDKFVIFLKISDIIDKELIAQTQNYIKESEILIIVSTILTVLLLIAFLINLFYIDKMDEAEGEAQKAQKNLGFDMSKEINEIASTIQYLGDQNTSYENKVKSVSKFNKIKNDYLLKVSENNKKRIKENFQSVNFLHKHTKELDMLKAINFLEENLGNAFLNVDNLINIVNIEESNERNIYIDKFSPQLLFKKALEVNMPSIRKKNIDYITYIDPSFRNKLEGDKRKILNTISNVILGVITQTSQYGKIVVEIKPASAQDSDITNILFIIKSNAKYIENDKSKKMLSNNEFFSEGANAEEFWFIIANNYLDTLGSKLFINNTDTGSEFFFYLKFKTFDRIEYDKVDTNLKLAFVEDSQKEYNDFFQKTIKGLGLDIKTYISDKSIPNDHNYDIVILREDGDTNVNLKNMIKLRNPLSTLGLLEILQNKFTKKSSQNFSLKLPSLLLVETNQINANLIKHAFDNYTLEINTASEHALNNPNLSYDFVVLDTSIQNINLINTIKKFKENPINENIPIIGLVSNTSDISMQNANEIFDAVLRKPISQKALYDVLARFIPNLDNFTKTNLPTNIEKQVQSILLFKKTSLENKIFADALSKFKDRLTVVNNFNEYDNELSTKAYGFVFVDQNPEFSINEILNSVENSRIKFDTDTRVYIFSNERESSLTKLRYYAKFLSPKINKSQLSSIIDTDFERERERANA
ncbi:MAG: hypothetical protein K5978_01130 [Campylobacter sp.]|nr:hypothetical protein [Campylobacter sp.]